MFKRLRLILLLGKGVVKNDYCIVLVSDNNETKASAVGKMSASQAFGIAETLLDSADKTIAGLSERLVNDGLAKQASKLNKDYSRIRKG